ncbi:MAG: hypothetical protein ACLPVY_02650 [Acidimicrobiia bacterium]
MPIPQGETTAAALLGTWTDSDTAMQIVGTSLGIFGPDLVDPELALSYETPLRNALFDVLLSLVEGGALDMRPTDDGLYAFRWRPDYAVAGLSSETSSAIDISAPSPYAAELIQMRRELDDALGRAQFAEALATERERLLRLADVPSPKPRVAARRAAPKARETSDAHDRSVLEVLYASPHQADESPADEIDIRDDTSDRDAVALDEPAPNAPAATPTTVAAKSAAPRRATKTRAKPKANVDPPKPTKAKANAAKAKTTHAPKARPIEAPDGAKPVEVSTDEPTAIEPTVEPTDVVFLPPPPPDIETDPAGDDLAADQDEDEAQPRRAKWSGYTLDKPRLHLSSVDRLADEG